MKYDAPPKVLEPTPGSNYHKLMYDHEYRYFRERSASRPKLEADPYYDIHKQILTPLPIVIDCDTFEDEIFQCDTKFEQFGNTHVNLERYSLGLTDCETNTNTTPHPVNWPMDVWNIQNPDTPLFDNDFYIANETFRSLTSLKEFGTIFNNQLARCTILKWNTGAHFKPHIDMVLPTPNLRIWGTNDPDNNHFCFWNDNTQQYEEQINIERGRLYLADTSIYHHAYATSDYVYTFFFALQINAYDTIKELLQPGQGST
jgi:hypothetical protein